MIRSFKGRYRFLSNFYPCQIKWEGKWYPTSEHAFQAAKTFDRHERELIRKLRTPGMARTAGRSVSLRADWEKKKIDIMIEILICKFSLNGNMKRLLFVTGEEELVEGNTWGDTFWGVCEGEGENWLGIILMGIRDDLRGEQ